MVVSQTIRRSQQDVLWREVEGLAEQLLQRVLDATPKEELEIATAHAYILGMFWRTVRLYDGTLLLLKAELPEEGAFLTRSLFEESLRLQQLAAEPEARNALILGWANKSIDEKRGLLLVAQSLGLDQNIDTDLASLEDERRHLHEYRTRHHVASLRSFRSVRDAAVQFDRKEDYLTYEWTHESVHGSDAAWMFGRRRTARDAAALHAKTTDPMLRAAFAEFAARSLADSALATFTIFGWPLPSELGQPATRMRRLLDEHAGRASP